MNIPASKKMPQEINVFIEIPQGGSIKYEQDEKSGALLVDRFIYTAMSYPFNYGSILGTKAEDGDPMDALVLSSQPVMVGTVLPSIPIGLLEMEDEAGIDTKIIAIPTAKIDPFMASINDINDLPEMTRNKIKHFFEHYKELEPGKWVKLKNFKSKKVAEEEIRKSIK